MANKTLFSTCSGQAADTTNRAGGKAYAKSKKAALASYALVGTFNDTFYSDARFHLDTVLDLLKNADDRYVAQVAIYARRDGYMKDMPSFLVAWLAAQRSPYFEKAFESVIDNGKMLRNFVQYIRSGVLGRKSFGTRIKRVIQNWFESRNVFSLMRALPGNDPTLADIIKMVHVKPGDKEHEAFYGWLIGKGTDGRTRQVRNLPQIVREFEAFKASLGTAGRPKETPNVPFQLLTGLPLTETHWKGIARNARWMMTRMNLNTFARHGVFEDKVLTKLIVERLRDPDEIRQARQFPYQLFMAYLNAGLDVPKSVRNALQDAMEVALENVPELEGETYVFVDVSSSMSWGAMGPKTKARCVDVAALFGSALLRRNPDNVYLIPVDTSVHTRAQFNDHDTVFTNVEKLVRYGGGGTNLGSAMQWLNQNKKNADLVIFVSDSESWMDRGWYGGATTVQGEFQKLRRRNKNAKLVNIDIQASVSSQAKTSAHVLNVAGFSDQVFNVIDAFVKGDLNGDHLVQKIEQSVEV